MFCSKCGEQIPEGAEFCVKCGTPAGGKRNRKGLIIGVAAATVAVVAVFIGVLYILGSENKAQLDPELSKYINYSEEEFIKESGYDKSDTGWYPSVENPMFSFQEIDGQSITSVNLKNAYPGQEEYSLFNIRLNNDITDASKKLEDRGFSLVTTSDSMYGGEKKYFYEQSTNFTLSIEGDSVGKIASITYSNAPAEVSAIGEIDDEEIEYFDEPEYIDEPEIDETVFGRSIESFFALPDTNGYLSLILKKEPGEVLIKDIQNEVIPYEITTYLNFGEEAPKAEIDKFVKSLFGDVPDKIYSLGENYDGSPMLIFKNGKYKNNVMADGDTYPVFEMVDYAIDGNEAVVYVVGYDPYEYFDYENGYATKPEPNSQWELKFEYDDASEFGCRPVSYTWLGELKKTVSAISNDNIVGISASSELSEYNMTHTSERAIDKDISTAWVEGSPGQGIGEYIKMQFDEVYTLNEIVIANGYQKSQDTYYKNSRPKEIILTFSDGSSESIVLEDVMENQSFYAKVPVETSSITFTISSVYPGNKFEDTCISEIAVY